MDLMQRVAMVLVCGFIFSSVYAENNICQRRNCAVVVDAGSSSSRLHVYAYDLDDLHHPVQITEVLSKKIKPGIAKLDTSQRLFNSYLSHMFDGIPEASMPVYFYATGGMRVISPSKQKLIYQWIQEWFEGDSQWQLVEAKTITGQEEGILSWLAVNYRLGVFNNNKPTVGVLDMGGASVQVTFPVQNIEKINPDDLRQVKVGENSYTLFTHSFLGLGEGLMAPQFLDEKNCFADGYQLPNGLPAKGDAVSCREGISHLINDVHHVDAIAKQAIANNAATIGDWYALGGVTMLLQDKLFTFDNFQFTNQSLLEQTDKQVCHQSWQVLSDKQPHNEYLYSYCLASAYYSALMVDGYGFSEKQVVNYSKYEMDWTLGVLLRSQ